MAYPKPISHDLYLNNSSSSCSPVINLALPELMRISIILMIPSSKATSHTESRKIQRRRCRNVLYHHHPSTSVCNNNNKSNPPAILLLQHQWTRQLTLLLPRLGLLHGQVPSSDPLATSFALAILVSPSVAWVLGLVVLLGEPKFDNWLYILYLISVWRYWIRLCWRRSVWHVAFLNWWCLLFFCRGKSCLYDCSPRTHAGSDFFSCLQRKGDCAWWLFFFPVLIMGLNGHWNKKPVTVSIPLPPDWSSCGLRYIRLSLSPTTSILQSKSINFSRKNGADGLFFLVHHQYRPEQCFSVSLQARISIRIVLSEVSSSLYRYLSANYLPSVISSPFHSTKLSVQQHPSSQFS